jgi:hypothetical protein
MKKMMMILLEIVFPRYTVATVVSQSENCFHPSANVKLGYCE